MVPETSSHGQPLSEKGFHEASGKALKDQKLRKNFKRAMNGLMQKRRIMFPDSGELETLRNLAGGIRRDVVSRLPDLLEELETNCQQNGIQVHWAQTTEEANSIVLNIARKWVSSISSETIDFPFTASLASAFLAMLRTIEFASSVVCAQWT